MAQIVNDGFPQWFKTTCGAATCGIVVLYLLQRYRRLKDSEKNDVPRDMVILHQIGRGSYAPSLSPFVMKLETYLRMAKIPYKNVHSFEAGPKGKFPWIEFNGTRMADTHFCIEFLNRTKDIDFNSHLSIGEKAIARAFQKMLEENTYWALVNIRWNSEGLSAMKNHFDLSFLQVWYFRQHLNKEAYYHGIGRHTKEEIYEILVADLKALSAFLGEKKFLFGEQPCETDCAVFGILSMPFYQSFGNKSGDAIKKFQNLCDHCERMRVKFWPDWDECITHGGTRKARQ